MNIDDTRTEVDTAAREALLESACEVARDMGVKGRDSLPVNFNPDRIRHHSDRLIDLVDNIEVRAVVAASGGDCSEQDLTGPERHAVRAAAYQALGYPL